MVFSVFIKIFLTSEKKLSFLSWKKKTRKYVTFGNYWLVTNASPSNYVKISVNVIFQTLFYCYLCLKLTLTWLFLRWKQIDRHFCVIYLFLLLECQMVAECSDLSLLCPFKAKVVQVWVKKWFRVHQKDVQNQKE